MAPKRKRGDGDDDSYQIHRKKPKRKAVPPAVSAKPSPRKSIRTRRSKRGDTVLPLVDPTKDLDPADLRAVAYVRIQGMDLDNKTSQPLKDYVKSVFERKDSLRWIITIEKLLDFHLDDDVWDDAGIIENYLYFFDWREIWAERVTRTGPKFTRAWSEAAESMEGDVLEEFRQLYRRARVLAEEDEIFNLPIFDPNGWVPIDTFVQDTISAFNAVEERLRQRAANSWLDMKNAVASSEGSITHKARYSDLEDAFLDRRTRYDEMTDAPGWKDGKSLAQYCDKVARLLKTKKDRRAHRNEQLWEKARLAAARDARFADIERAWQQWRTDMDKGVETYGPLETPSDPAMTNVARAPTLDFAADRAEGLTGDTFKGTWRFQATLGEGGFGHAGLWVKLNPQNAVIDRTVAKESYMRDDMWKRCAFWANDDVVSRIPNEWSTMTELSSKDDGDSILPCHGYGIYETLKMVRLYLAYCEHGDLDEFIAHYMGAFDSSDDDATDRRVLLCKVVLCVPLMRDRHIPQTVVWQVFHALASALCLMELGTTTDSSGAVLPGHVTMTHQDIKPGNGMHAIVLHPSSLNADNLQSFSRRLIPRHGKAFPLSRCVKSTDPFPDKTNKPAY